MKKVIKKIKSVCRLLCLKIKYGSGLCINKKTIHCNIESMDSIIVKKSIMVLRGAISVCERVIISANSGAKMTIGDNLFVNVNSMIVSKGEISIGNNVVIGPNCHIYDHDHAFGRNGKKEGYSIGKVTIGNNVWIGANVIVLKNTRIGDNCIIGAGTVVKGLIPDNSLVTNDRRLIIKKLHD